jgi:hypothetical protein
MSDRYDNDLREFIDVLDNRGLKSGGTKRCRRWRSKTRSTVTRWACGALRTTRWRKQWRKEHR